MTNPTKSNLLLETLVYHLVSQRCSSLLLESKQQLVNLGIPEVVAGIFLEKFGNKAGLLGKWYKDYKAFKKDASGNIPLDWFNTAFWSWSADRFQLPEMIEMYNSARESEEKYHQARIKHGLSRPDSEPDVFDQKELLTLWKETIKEKQSLIFWLFLLAKVCEGAKITIWPTPIPPQMLVVVLTVWLPFTMLPARQILHTMPGSFSGTQGFLCPSDALCGSLPRLLWQTGSLVSRIFWTAPRRSKNLPRPGQSWEKSV